MNEVNQNYKKILDSATQVFKGKENVLALSLVGAFSLGHQLIEDTPGMGKTTLVYLLAKLLGLEISRIQFTSDLMPSDVLGINVFNQARANFEFKKGPIFGEMILADELNRAGPRTQSALLQAMDEKRISIDGVEYNLPNPFLVMATQNPTSQVGTYPLPESQIDRFFMSLTLDFPTREFEKEIIIMGDIRKKIEKMSAVIDKKTFHEMVLASESVKVSDAISDYVLDILNFGRREFEMGAYLSPRAGRDLIRAGKTRSFLMGRSFVVPEDIQFVMGAILSHRLGAIRGVRYGNDKVCELIKAVPIQ